MDSPCSIITLPPEVLMVVVRFLGLPRDSAAGKRTQLDLYHACLVSRRWYKVANPALWSRIALTTSNAASIGRFLTITPAIASMQTGWGSTTFHQSPLNFITTLQLTSSALSMLEGRPDFCNKFMVSQMRSLARFHSDRLSTRILALIASCPNIRFISVNNIFKSVDSNSSHDEDGDILAVLQPLSLALQHKLEGFVLQFDDSMGDEGWQALSQMGQHWDNLTSLTGHGIPAHLIPIILKKTPGLESLRLLPARGNEVPMNDLVLRFIARHCPSLTTLHLSCRRSSWNGVTSVDAWQELIMGLRRLAHVNLSPSDQFFEAASMLKRTVPTIQQIHAKHIEQDQVLRCLERGFGTLFGHVELFGSDLQCSAIDTFARHCPNLTTLQLYLTRTADHPSAGADWSVLIEPKLKDLVGGCPRLNEALVVWEEVSHDEETEEAELVSGCCGYGPSGFYSFTF